VTSTTETTTVLYTGKTHTTGGRDGASRTDDGRLDIKLSSPGSKLPGTNPEQLFAAGWSACFLGALQLAAASRKLRLPTDAAIDAEIDLRKGETGYSLGARLHVRLPGLDPELASALAEQAHETCPYSKATRGTLDVAIDVTV
jgi:osmotically inducible protein OsmC